MKSKTFLLPFSLDISKQNFISLFQSQRIFFLLFVSLTNIQIISIGNKMNLVNNSSLPSNLCYSCWIKIIFQKIWLLLFISLILVNLFNRSSRKKDFFAPFCCYKNLALSQICWSQLLLMAQICWVFTVKIFYNKHTHSFFVEEAVRELIRFWKDLKYMNLIKT